MDKEINPDKESQLYLLKEEFNLIQQKKNLLRENEKIMKEIYINVKNRLELDPFITDKLKFKQKKDSEGKCCLIY